MINGLSRSPGVAIMAASGGLQVAKKTPFVHTLRRAMRALGSREELARRLEVSLADLSRWMRGEDAPPPRVYLTAIDLVTRRGVADARPER